MSFVYYYEHGEANFGEPLKTEVAGGSHLTTENILHIGTTIYALRLPDGIHGATKNALYFPHGLIRFGEKHPDCVQRVVKEFADVNVTRVQTYNLSTWVDDSNHWHMCLNSLVEIDKPPEMSDRVSEIVSFTKNNIPKDIEWWTPQEMDGIFKFLESHANA
jgi:hypothetical protein